MAPECHCRGSLRGTERKEVGATETIVTQGNETPLRLRVTGTEKRGSHYANDDISVAVRGSGAEIFDHLRGQEWVVSGGDQNGLSREMVLEIRQYACGW
jgi:hypothetical protein